MTRVKPAAGRAPDSRYTNCPGVKSRKRGLTQSSSTYSDAVALVTNGHDADGLVAAHEQQGGALRIRVDALRGEVGRVGAMSSACTASRCVQEGVIGRYGMHLVDRRILCLTVEAREPVRADERDRGVHGDEGPDAKDGVVSRGDHRTREVHPAESQHPRLHDGQDDEGGADPTDGFQEGMHALRVGGGPNLES